MISVFNNTVHNYIDWHQVKQTSITSTRYKEQVSTVFNYSLNRIIVDILA